jgi:serine/threonine-protein kinase
MGEVYRARDTRLQRDVAVKVLPDAFTSDPDRIARFQREAQVLASLNHPNIAQVYGLERLPAPDHIQALVMELVEGPTLADLIGGGGAPRAGKQVGLPLNDVLAIARQIADALDAAHEQGIVHRDLKPANVKVRPDGTVKVLDFGLAKSVASTAGQSSSVSQSPTITTPAMTQAGVILGTATYMSPEQAKGRPADKRSDIWSFGAVLYEMLTGRRAFDGDDVSDTLAAVLRAEPDWSALPAGTPPALAVVLKRCLQKDVRQRVRDVGDVRLALDGAFDAPTTSTAIVPPATVSRGGSRVLWAAFAGVVGAAVAAGTIWLTSSSSAPVAEPMRFGLAVPAGDQLFATGQLPVPLGLALSPDEGEVTYSAVRNGRQQLFRRSLGDLDAAALAGTEGGSFPFYSPDGAWIGYLDIDDRSLKKIPADGGGVPVSVSQVTQATRGAVWMPDGSIVFGQEFAALQRVPDAGGSPVPLMSLDQDEAHHRAPAIVPSARGVIFESWPSRTLHAFHLDTNVRQALTAGTRPQVTSDGRLLFERDGSLWSAPLDVETLTLSGEPQIVLTHATPDVWVDDFVVGARGTLVYRTRRAGNPLQMFTPVWVTRDGREAPLPLPARAYESPRVSPDGFRVAVSVASERRGENDLWVYDVRTGAGARVTHGGHNRNPIWTADGTQILYSSTLNAPIPAGSTQQWWGNLYRVRADGSGHPERLTNTEVNQALSGASPDGRLLLFTRVVGPQHWEITRIDLDRGGETTALVPGPFTRASAEISPDGQLISYRSNDSGAWEVYVQTYPSLDARVPVSIGGGEEPVWSADSRSIFYRTGDRVMAVEIQRAPRLGASAPVELFSAAYRRGGGGRGREYHVGPDGRFLMLKPMPVEDTTIDAPPFVVVLNWFEELKARAR